MSTFATDPIEYPGTTYGEADDPRIVRLSHCLATGDVGLDVETTSAYDRTVLEPAAAEALGHALVAAASAGRSLR